MTFTQEEARAAALAALILGMVGGIALGASIVGLIWWLS